MSSTFIPKESYLYYYRYTGGKKLYYTVDGSQIARGKIPKNVVDYVEEYPPTLEYRESLPRFEIYERHVKDSTATANRMMSVMATLEKSIANLIGRHGSSIDFDVTDDPYDPRYYYYKNEGEGKKQKRVCYDYRHYLSVFDRNQKEKILGTGVVHTTPLQVKAKRKDVKDIMDKIYACRKKYLIISKKYQLRTYELWFTGETMKLSSTRKEMNKYKEILDRVRDRVETDRYQDIEDENYARRCEYHSKKKEFLARNFPNQAHYENLFFHFFTGGFTPPPPPPPPPSPEPLAEDVLDGYGLKCRKDYLKWLLTNHPDKKPGNEEVFKEVTAAATIMKWINNNNHTNNVLQE
jgi:hypothetical protein